MPQAFLLLLLLCLPVFAQTGKVVRVSDGDTIAVLANRKQIKVRLAGIDAPEKGQDYGNAAKKNLSGLIFNQTINLEGSKVDRYGRLVTKVILNGRDIDYMMVESGLAWHFKQYAKEQSREDRIAYGNAESRARENKLNLWRYPNPSAPWDYRAGRRTPAEPTQTRSQPSRNPSTETTSTIRPLVSRPNYQSSDGRIVGNKNSMIFHAPGCRDYNKVSEKNRLYFRTPAGCREGGI